MNLLKAYKPYLLFSLLLLTFNSCLKLVMPSNPKPEEEEKRYLYPFSNEVNNIIANIYIDINEDVDLNQPEFNDIITEIPHLKYNKTWLLLISQDDTRQDSFSSTFAAIHGRPVPAEKYYYDIEHLEKNDLPPDTLSFGKTLGHTDGAGNEVRFSFLITVQPQEEWMGVKPNVNPGFTGNFNRFLMKSGLTYNNVKEMMNYGVGIAFHDVKTLNVNNKDSVCKHIEISQSIILDSLLGRGCKTLAEPNGNKVYIDAARMLPFIHVITAQQGVLRIHPFQIDNDLYQVALGRWFHTESTFRVFVENQLIKPKEQREAVSLGVHGTRIPWANNLLWLNDTYGKDGDDSMWAPNIEEYYEYNYYRVHGKTDVKRTGRRLHLEINLPAVEYFYYPSVTVNVKGIKMADIASITSGDEVKGMSYADYDGGVMVNIDCRKYLLEHATHYVEKYEKSKLKHLKSDAIYFVNMLKDSPAKKALQSRLGQS